jgi:hypothetical protein
VPSSLKIETEVYLTSSQLTKPLDPGALGPLPNYATANTNGEVVLSIETSEELDVGYHTFALVQFYPDYEA